MTPFPPELLCQTFLPQPPSCNDRSFSFPSAKTQKSHHHHPPPGPITTKGSFLGPPPSNAVPWGCLYRYFYLFFFRSFSYFCPERVQAPLCPSALNLAFICPPYAQFWLLSQQTVQEGLFQSSSHLRGLKISSWEVCIYCSLSTAISFVQAVAIGVLIPLKVPSELAQPLQIPTWLRHLILDMNFSALPPRI